MAIGDELASLDFQSMIGGPLSAIVRAQAEAAMTSVDFMKAVGFHGADHDEHPNEPVMVTFEYMKAVEETADNGSVTVDVKPFELTVPLLTMLPIPFIRIEETTIDFNAKINSVQESTTASDQSFQGSLEAKAGWGWGSAKLKTSYSYKRSTSSSSSIERTYSMAVHVLAKQDELPAGTERLLGILENTISEVEKGTE